MGRETRGYDALAWFYDRYWACTFHDAARPALQHLFYSKLPSGARVLELCCGSGHLTSELIARGYDVLGIDNSIEMLRHARRRAPSARLACADLPRCSLRRGVWDAAVATFDSINHLLSAADVSAAFRCVAHALRPGGLFVFDVNMEGAYESEWGKSSARVEPDAALFVRGSYEPGSALGRTAITAFRLEGAVWRRTDVEIAQRCYSERQLTELLASAGFGRIAMRAAADVGMTGDIAVGRTFCSAHTREGPVDIRAC